MARLTDHERKNAARYIAATRRELDQLEDLLSRVDGFRQDGWLDDLRHAHEKASGAVYWGTRWAVMKPREN